MLLSSRFSKIVRTAICLTLVFAMIMTVVFLPPELSPFGGSRAEDGESWLTGWNYRKSSVINATSGAGTNYQVLYYLHYGAGTDNISTYSAIQTTEIYLSELCQSDFDDIRFTDDDGETLLDYYIESKVNEVNAVVWVEIADDISSSATTVYLYYGNSSATSLSNGTATFATFYDCSSTSGWTGDTGYLSSSGGVYTYSNPTAVWKQIQSTNTVSSNNALRVYVDDDGVSKQYGFDTATTPQYRIASAYDSTNAKTRMQITLSGTASYTDLVVNVHNRLIYNWYELHYHPTAQQWYINGTLTHSYSASISATMKIIIQAYQEISYYDTIIIRKCVPTEPVHYTIGSQEENPSGVLPKTEFSYFYAYDIMGSNPLTVNFYDISLGSPTSWGWEFGDGATSTAQNPVHTYSEHGTYAVNLTATNAIGSVEYSLNVTTYQASDAFYTAPSLSSVIGETYWYLPELAVEGITNYSLTTNAPFLTMNYGTGNISGTPSSMGRYSVNLKVTCAGPTYYWQNYTLTVYDFDNMAVQWNIANSGIYPVHDYGEAVIAQGKLFIAYEGTASNGSTNKEYFSNYIGEYDLNNKTWKASYRLSETIYYDGHCGAALVMDQNGYLHAWYGAHESDMGYSRSDLPYNASSWTVVTAQFAGAGGATYPCPMIDPLTGDLYCAFRNNDVYWTVLKSTDNGTTWGSQVYPVYNVYCFYYETILPVVHDGEFYIMFGGELTACTSWGQISSTGVFNRFNPGVMYYKPSNGHIYNVTFDDSGLTQITSRDQWKNSFSFDYYATDADGDGPNQWGMKAVLGPNDYPFCYWGEYNATANRWYTSVSQYDPDQAEWVIERQISWAAPSSNNFGGCRIDSSGNIELVFTNQTIGGNSGIGGSVQLMYKDHETGRWQTNGTIFDRHISLDGGSLYGAHCVANTFEHLTNNRTDIYVFNAGIYLYAYDVKKMTFLNNVTGFISDPVTEGEELVLYSYQTSSSIDLTDFSLSGASFLSVNATGYVSGTPQLWDSGTYAIVISGESSGVTYWQNYTLVISEADSYTITSTPVTTGQEGIAYSYQAVCSGTVTSWSISGTTFLSISGSGLVSGTPGSGTSGTYSITIQANTTGYPTWQNYTLEIEGPSVTYVFTSTPGTTVYEGFAYSYQGAINGTADSWGLGGNATFLTISGSGLVSGTPGAGTEGTYTVSISATIDGTTIYQNYTLEVEETPFFTSSPITTGYAGFGYNYQPTTSGEVISWSLSGGGASLYINETTGRVSSSGLGAIGTTYTLSITATTADGTYWQNYTLTVVNMFTSSPDTTGKDYEAYSYQVAARETAISWTITGPDWLTISATGLVSGTPPLGSDGVYNITVQVRTLINEVPAWSSQDYTLTILPDAAYAVTSDPVTNATANETYEYQVTSRYTVTIWNITGPDWLAINATGMITGTAPNGTQGSFNISVLLTLTDGTLAYQNYTLEVEGPPTSWSDGMAIAFGILAFLIVVSALLSIMGSARRRY